MKTLLCTIPLDLGPRDAGELPIPPKIAIVSLIYWMKKSGYTHKSYDFLDIDMLNLSDEEIGNYLKKSNPTIIGLSAVVSTAYLAVKRVAAIARKACPDAWIVMGGYLSASANVVLRKTGVDICVQGDGEIPFLEFIRYVEKHGRTWIYTDLSKIKGLTYIDHNNQLINNGFGDSIPALEVPFPDYEIFKLGLKERTDLLDNYFRNGLLVGEFKTDYRTFETNRNNNVATFWVSKGCVAKCTFCQRSSRKLSRFDLNKLDEHLNMLVKKFNVGFVHILDENFGADKKHTYEVAKILKKYNILWMCSGVRCTNVNLHDVIFYHDCGCSALKYGVESGSQLILNVMEKRFDKEQVRQAIGFCVQTGIFSPLAVMVGMPGETDQTVKETGVFVGELACLQNLPLSEIYKSSIFYAYALPGTPLYTYGQQVGAIGTSLDDEEEYLISVSDKGADKINHINLSGAPMKNLIFWDFMLRFEAYRAWHKLHKNNKSKSGSQANSQISKCFSANQNKIRFDILFNQIKQKLKSYKDRTLLDIIKQPRIGIKKFIRDLLNNFYYNYLVPILPRAVLYPILRNLFYMVFLLRRMVARNKAKKIPKSGRHYILSNLYKNYSIPPQLSKEQIALIEDGTSLRELIQ